MSKEFTSSELRQVFLDYFLSKKHIELPPASLVPKGDPTLLFTSAGMVQFKKYYTSLPPAGKRRAVTVQKCLRASDLELVGTSPRHHTFFEMLGNFSFGDYFKREAVIWAWEFATSNMGIPVEKLSATVYEEDDEAREIWIKEIGLAENLVIPLGKDDNWWGPAGATGPCGPCSELHYDMGPELGCGRPDCAPGCDCDRYIEFWNLVFPQFYQDEDKQLTPLPSPGIDTGMGLERLALITQGKQTVYETDLLAPVVDAVLAMAPGVKEKSASGDAGVTTALRVIADHARGLVFALSEGILPSNDGRGYLLRRILRRAVRRGFDLGLDEPFMYKLAGSVAEVMGESPRLYAYLGERRAHVETVMRGEEERFFHTIEAGVAKFSEMAGSLASEPQGTFPGEWAFVLYDTFGFPPDMTREMAAEKGLSWDEDGLEREMEKQRQRARNASTFGAKSGEAREWIIVSESNDSVFTGYESTYEKSRVVRYRPGAGDGVEVVLDRTPFYAESGGQVGDTGWIRWPGGEIVVKDTVRDADSIVHIGQTSTIPDQFPVEVEAAVDENRRRDIKRNHTATHLLHAALRRVLGDHVAQSGSHVTPDRFRFDFSHYGPLKDDEIKRVEGEINEAVGANIPVETSEKTLAQAQKDGAIALFDEKYGDSVRQVTVGDVSSEVCGGTHVSASGDIGPFVVASQSAVGSGVRRIEALTGEGAWKRIREAGRILKALENVLGAQGDEAVDKARALIKERDELAKVAASSREKDLAGHAAGLMDKIVEMGGAQVVIAEIPGAAIPELRKMGDQLRKTLATGVAVLASVSGGKVSFMAAVTDDLVKDRNVSAGKIVSEVAKVAGGSGGGKPHLALAGAKDPGALNKALDAARDIVSAALET